MTDDQPERDLTSLLIAERTDIISTAKTRVTDLEQKREHLARCGNALGREIADAAFQVHGMKDERARANLDKLILEESTLKSDARCVSLALAMARRRVAQIGVIFDRHPARSEADRKTRAMLAARSGETSYDSDPPAA